jgi:gliding motility-associated-like protein
MKLTRIFLLVLSTLFFLLCRAQDVTLTGSVTCGAAAVTGTWTVPCDVTAISIEVYGGGGGAGGGGGGSNGGFFNTRGGGGAGGGGYTTITINVTPGSSFTYSIGSGGCGGSNGSDGSSGGNGTGGGNTTFNGTAAGGAPVNLTANGGTRGTGGSGTNGSPGSGGAGGGASGGSTNTTGSAGNSGSGGTGGNGGAGAGPSGGGGGVANSGNGTNYGGGGAGGGDSPGGRGGTGGILITYTTTNPLPSPLIASTAPTCTTDGTSTISNYNAALTYIFSPAGPTVGAGGVINGMVTGTGYTVIASDGSCNSSPSSSFSNGAAISIPVPIVSTTPPDCSSDGTSTISNYNSSLTYIFSPSGPSVGAGGIINNMTTGTGYTVSASDGTCSSPSSSSFSNGAQFPPPVATISGSLSYCTGGNTTLTGSGGTSYSWTDSGGNNIGNNANITVTQGTYTLVVTDANSCTASATATVTETTSLTVNITGTLIYCPGGNTTITANGGTSYNWSNASTNQTITVTSGTYSVTASDASGCTGTSSVTITEYPMPVITISGNFDYCLGNNTTLTANGGVSYVWNDSGGSTTSTITVTQGNYSVTGTDGNNCTASASAIVTENPLPVVTITGSTIYCTGGSTTITANGGISYAWSNGTTTSTNTVTQGSYSVTVTDSNGCTDTTSVTVTELSNPVADFLVNPACAGEPISFTNNSSPSGLNYLWNFGNGNSSSSSNPVETFNQGGNFTVILIVSDGSCSDTTTQTLQVYTTPLAGFSASPLRVIENEDSVRFTNISTGADTYLWDFGDGGTSADTSPSHIYSNTGFYTVTLIASNQFGCVDTFSRTDYIEVFDKPRFYIPNAFSPNGDGINDEFRIYATGIKEIYLTIFNRWGEQVFYTEDLRSGWKGTINGNEGEQAVYVYYVKAVFNDLTINTYKGSVTLLR